MNNNQNSLRDGMPEIEDVGWGPQLVEELHAVGALNPSLNTADEIMCTCMPQWRLCYATYHMKLFSGPWEIELAPLTKELTPKRVPDPVCPHAHAHSPELGFPESFCESTANFVEGRTTSRKPSSGVGACACGRTWVNQ